MKKILDLYTGSLVHLGVNKKEKIMKSRSFKTRQEMIDYLQEGGDYKGARTLICSQARPEEYDDIYKFMYRNLDLWGTTEQQQDQAIVLIRNGMAKSSLCADPEINLAATLIELQLNAT